MVTVVFQITTLAGILGVMLGVVGVLVCSAVGTTVASRGASGSSWVDMTYQYYSH